MNSQIIIAAIQGGSQLISKVLDKRPVKISPMQAESPEDALERIYGKGKETVTKAPVSEIIVTDVTDEAEQEKPVGTACIPCGLSHVATCAGELNEAVRFSRKDIEDPEVVVRIDHCLSEIAACERIDLAPENIISLPPNEKRLADTMATQLRDIRHGLEWFKTKEDLEELAAKTANLQHEIGREWLKIRINSLTPEERAQVKAKVQDRLGEGFDGLLSEGTE